MADARAIAAVDEAAWNGAVARANVLRRLAGQEGLSRAVVLEACRELGVRRAQLYQLLRVYRTHPVTSSLINRATGSRAGARRLSAAVKALIDEAIPSKARRHRLTLAPVDYAAAALAARDEEARKRLRAALEARQAGLRRRVQARFRALAAEKASARARWAGPKGVSRRPVSRTPEVFSRALGSMGTAYFGLRSFSLTKSAPETRT